MPERLAIPLRLVDGRLATVQQDSDDDVAQCVLAIGRTRPGDRWDEPTLGVSPLAFAELPADTTLLAQTIARHEPRRAARVGQQPPRVLDALGTVQGEITIEIEAQDA